MSYALVNGKLPEASRLRRNLRIKEWKKRNPHKILLYKQVWRERNRSKWNSYSTARKHRVNKEIYDYKSSTPCADCKMTYPYYVMDFDHKSGKRDKANDALVARLIAACAPKKRIWAEIAKCDLVCSNCHRARTFRRRQASKITSREATS